MSMTLTSEDIANYQRAVQIAEQEQLERIKAQNQYSQLSSGLSSNKDPNIIEFQLDVTMELDRIYHLLSGHIQKTDKNGNEYWSEPDDDRLKIFSDYGVKQIMNLISFYISKNTLLSNFDEDTIKWKVRDFGIELADLIYCRYEHFFYYPTPEDLFDKSVRTIKQYPEHFYDLITESNGEYVVNEEYLYEKCLEWSHNEMLSKLRHYGIIVLALVDSIHSTFLRALKGNTFTKVNTNTNVHQNINSMPESMQPQKRGLFGWAR